MGTRALLNATGEGMYKLHHRTFVRMYISYERDGMNRYYHVPQVHTHTRTHIHTEYTASISCPPLGPGTLPAERLHLTGWAANATKLWTSKIEPAVCLLKHTNAGGEGRQVTGNDVVRIAQRVYVYLPSPLPHSGDQLAGTDSTHRPRATLWAHPRQTYGSPTRVEDSSRVCKT